MESNFTLTDGISGPVLATILIVQIILALIANGVVLSITFYQWKSLKLSSTIFFTSVILAHLVLNLLYLPFRIIALAAGEWVFGSTNEEKKVTCTFAAFFFWWMVLVILMTVAAISFDRFLFIVKPQLHKRFMRSWVALTLTIAIWILSAALSNVHIFAFHLYIAICIRPSNSIGLSIYFVLLSVTILGIIFVTSLWTFCFTRSFFKNQSVIAAGSVYASKKKRLFGVFGSMLLIYGICFVPGFLYFFLSLFIDVPVWFETFAIICFDFITVANPIIQSYFRPEIKSVLVPYFPFHICVCC
ncbi:PREDICTED: high-affinity lysophosphatidic acid receptor-like [Amphimedon queenslandica]|uniref:G-protein coupled receptors family 1 profile domain-containing protein n=1 Tax=Amphimedon queenslandica TaxID=400682 RepID=A0A1X7VT89_AMPQE|nr:PREDICTED: high-affinity lysophosphatidic acid receptor-like [Amphimedon queenslandica]|eukprot:XP_019854054.1 PREDICTED: high-affinity lysophosphatidic acid receptor-like [Amphimedon queenslandica]